MKTLAIAILKAENRVIPGFPVQESFRIAIDVHFICKLILLVTLYGFPILMQALISNQPQVISFDEFMAWYPSDSSVRYELHDGMIVAMPKPKGKHSEIAGFIISELNIKIKQLNLPYLIPRECIVKYGDVSGYEPDIIILSKESLRSEPRWDQETTILSGESALLVIEVVSSNWSDDYAMKLDAYETLGIREYWIVDYLGIGGRKFIGNPKQPTLSIYSLRGGLYHLQQFRDNQVIQSDIFPSLGLTALQVFKAE